MNVKRLLIFFIILSFFFGCNINLFSPFHNADNDTSLISLLADGNAALENNNYEDAMKYFQKAMENYPASGKARLGYGAAYVGFKNVDFLNLFNILSDDTAADTDPMFSKADSSFYQDITKTVQSTLFPIFLGQCDLPKSDGETNINLAFTSILLGTLVVFDVDQNGSFTDNCDVLYFGRDMNVHGFDQFPFLSGTDKGLIVNNINGDLDKVVYYINISTTAINNAVSALDLDKDDPELLNDLNDTAETIAHQIQFYRYKDGVDNDDDWIDINQNTQQDTMVWSDDNHNGTIDDTTGTPWTYDRVNLLVLPLDATWFSTNGGEWQDGDFGVDEELIDGIDNDSDGTVDEDSGGHI
ncbi:tetratricopeptide repeat protein [bacterium]|nr:tetratricopeptide repeat protein [bacterium]